MSLPPPYLVTGHGVVVGEAIYLLRELLLAQAHLAPGLPYNVTDRLVQVPVR